MASPIFQDPGAIHPDLWLASQLARSTARTIATGYPSLDAELPDHGWPIGAAIDLLCMQPGIGEMRLILPALKTVSARPIFLLNPINPPNHPAFSYWGLKTDQITLLRAKSTADTLWAAEQALRNGSVGALLLWRNRFRNEEIRRLNVAAAASDTLLFLFQPLYSKIQSSPAQLRLVLRPAPDGVDIDFIKRRGPTSDIPLRLALHPSPILLAPRRTQVPISAESQGPYTEASTPTTSVAIQ